MLISSLILRRKKNIISPKLSRLFQNTWQKVLEAMEKNEEREIEKVETFFFSASSHNFDNEIERK